MLVVAGFSLRLEGFSLRLEALACVFVH